MPRTMAQSMAVAGIIGAHGKLGQGHQHAHRAEIEIDDHRAVFFPQGFDQGHRETGKSAAGQGHGLAEQVASQAEIEQHGDTDDDHGDAADFGP
jgi:hypothetical protein